VGTNTELVRGRGVGKSAGTLKFCAYYRELGYTLASCLKVTCFDYNKQGHIAPYYPKKKKLGNGET
jgi:hypothetical protein